MGVLRLQMHATAPDPAEQTLGTPQSEGCVRIPALLNEFVDRHGCRAKTVNGRLPQAGICGCCAKTAPPQPVLGATWWWSIKSP